MMKTIFFPANSFILILCFTVCSCASQSPHSRYTKDYPVFKARAYTVADPADMDKLFQMDRFRLVKDWCIDQYDQVDVDLDKKRLDWPAEIKDKVQAITPALPTVRCIHYEANKYADTLNLYKVSDDSQYYLHDAAFGFSVVKSIAKNPWAFNNSYGKVIYVEGSEHFYNYIKTRNSFTYCRMQGDECKEKQIIVRGAVELYRNNQLFDILYVLDELITDTVFEEPINLRRISIYSDRAKAKIHGTMINEDKEQNTENKKNIYPNTIIYVDQKMNVVVTASKELANLWNIIQSIPDNWSPY